jgi:hypothetical protein
LEKVDVVNVNAAISREFNKDSYQNKKLKDRNKDYKNKKDKKDDFFILKNSSKNEKRSQTILTTNTSQTFYQNLIKSFSKTIIKADIFLL